MDISGKYEDRMHRFILSCDSFTTAYTFMLLVFLLPFAAERGQLIASAVVPLCFLLTFALLPLVYALLNRWSPLLFGRYHLAMPITAFASATFFALFWSAGEGDKGTCIAVFASALFILFSAVYRYCSSSVRVRLTGDSIANPSALSFGFGTFGAVSAVGAVYGFYRYDPQTALLNAAYVLAAVGVILAMAQYLTSYYSIPRLSGKHIQPVRSVFRAFYTGLDKSVYFSSLLFFAADCVVAALAVRFCGTQVQPEYTQITAVAALIAAFAGAGAVCRRVRRPSRALSAACMLFILGGAALFAVIVPLGLIGTGRILCAMGACVLSGIGGALSLRRMRLCFLTVRPRMTSGIVHMLLELTMYAAMAIAVAVATAVSAMYETTGEPVWFVYGFGASAAFGIAAFFTALKRARRSNA